MANCWHVKSTLTNINDRIKRCFKKLANMERNHEDMNNTQDSQHGMVHVESLLVKPLQAKA